MSVQGQQGQPWSEIVSKGYKGYNFNNGQTDLQTWSSKELLTAAKKTVMRKTYEVKAI